MTEHEKALKEYRTRIEEARKTWPPGPWNDEPDRVQFESHGFDCLLVRGPLGAWCGYVGVPPGHPWHGKHYDDVDADAHGGLTFAEKCGGAVCHIPKPGAPDDLWWLGFDCGHAGDVVPGIVAVRRQIAPWAVLERSGEYEGDKYRTLPEVRAETEYLAEQALAAAQG